MHCQSTRSWSIRSQCQWRGIQKGLAPSLEWVFWKGVAGSVKDWLPRRFSRRHPWEQHYKMRALFPPKPGVVCACVHASLCRRVSSTDRCRFNYWGRIVEGVFLKLFVSLWAWWKWGCDYCLVSYCFLFSGRGCWPVPLVYSWFFVEDNVLCKLA